MLEAIRTRLKKLLRYGLVLLAVLLIISLIRSIFRISAANERIHEAQQKVEKLEAEKAELSQKVEAVKTDEFVEKQARDKLGLAKGGETVVVLPEEEVLKKLAPNNQEEELETLPDPNWMRWLKLFL